jgi:hypothetical protein
MEPTFEANVPQSGLEDHPGRLGAAKQKLGQLGRKLKRIEVRETIVDHPFAAIGIAAGIGAIIGLARPMPHKGRVSTLLMAGISALGMRFIREAAMQHLGGMAKDWITGQSREQQGGEAQYSPAYENR